MGVISLHMYISQIIFTFPHKYCKKDDNLCNLLLLYIDDLSEMKSENDSFVSQKDGTEIETQECKYDEDLKDVSKSLGDKSAKYGDAGSILTYAVSSIVECEVILLASNYDEYTGPLLFKLRSIKDELGMLYLMKYNEYSNFLLKSFNPVQKLIWLYNTNRRRGAMCV